MHEIHLKRVYEAAEPSDGVRVLVDRLWPRGIRKADLPYDVWAKEVTPSSELRTLYHRGEMPFAGFREGTPKNWKRAKAQRPLPSAAGNGSRRRT